MKNTNIFQKLGASITNIFVVVLFSVPLIFIPMQIFDKKIIVISIFFFYTLIFLILNKNRDLGMIIMGTFWKKKYLWYQHLVFNVFYTFSFATIFFWIKYPFDLLIFNLLVLQLPIILLTGTTFHGFIAGGMLTVFKPTKNKH